MTLGIGLASHDFAALLLVSLFSGTFVSSQSQFPLSLTNILQVTVTYILNSRYSNFELFAIVSGTNVHSVTVNK